MIIDVDGKPTQQVQLTPVDGKPTVVNVDLQAAKWQRVESSKHPFVLFLFFLISISPASTLGVALCHMFCLDLLLHSVNDVSSIFVLR